MKTKTITLYEFDELDERAKERAREWYREGALDYEWWDCTYEDAKTIGLKIEGFDLVRNRHAEGYFTKSVDEVYQAIMRERGKGCETYKIAADYAREFDELYTKLDQAQQIEDNEDQESEIESHIQDLEQEFLKDLLEEYSILLQHEYEYLLSDEAVDETIRANEYTFTESGKRED